MADTLVERLNAAAGTAEYLGQSDLLVALLREAADRIGLLTRSLEILDCDNDALRHEERQS
jgi:hypothetical protein